MGLKSKIVLFLCSILLFSSISTTMVQAGGLTKVDGDSFVSEFDRELNIENSDEVLKVLVAIEEIPENVLYQGIEETAKWIEEETNLIVNIEGENLVFPELAQGIDNAGDLGIEGGVISSRSLLNCISVVGLAVAGNGLPFTKILKLRQALKLLGGVKKSVERIHTTYKKYRSQNWRAKPAFERSVKEVSKSLPKETQEAFLDFFGITAIITACT